MARRRKPSNPFEGVSPEIEREIRKARKQERLDTLEDVVAAAFLYEEEKGRTDNAHRARMSKRRESLEEQIGYASEARQPITEVDEFDIRQAERAIERRRLREEEQRAEAAKGPTYENVTSLVPRKED